MEKIKVRFKTWYWGNYCFASKKESENLPDDFEVYNEDLHGWKNSEEFKLYGKSQYQTGEEEGNLESFVNSSYYQSLKKNETK